MSHSHHGGGGGGFQETNRHLARTYWYLIAGATGLAVAVRGINYLENRRRLNRSLSESIAHPTKPSSRFSQSWATATAIVRESSHPQLYVPFRGLRWVSPPSLGRVFLMLAYWAVVIYMAAGHGVIKDDVFFTERIGFRNAWVTIMQLPLLFLLAMKVNPLGFLVGTSHERLNWFHRWVGRTMFVTATVHGGYWWARWVKTDMFEWQMIILPSTKQGIGAWAVLLWIFVTGVRPLRYLGYEVFVIQHVASFAVFLWLVYIHIPIVARPYLWAAIACVAFDRVARWSLLAWQNLRAKPDPSNCRRARRWGHQVQLRAVGSSTTVITIKDVPFSWKPGQHLYLWLPWIAPFEAHPYTVACAHQLPETCTCNSVQLVVRKHGGFSKRLHNYATKMQAEGRGTEKLTAFVTGPFGVPPRWDIYETLILISASTGASFTLPILEAAVRGTATRSCLRRIEFILTAAQGEEVDFYIRQLRDAVARAQSHGLELAVHVAITRSDAGMEGLSSMLETDAQGQRSSSSSGSSLQQRRSPSADQNVSGSDIEKGLDSAFGPHANEKEPRPGMLDRSNTAELLKEYTTRLDIEALIREPVEASGGETSVVVCGGQSLTSSVRNCVARLSDERAVHKGTGAQGIHLFVEEYSF